MARRKANAPGPAVERPQVELPEGRSTVEVKDADSYLPGTLGMVSDYLFKISTFQIFLGMLMAASYMGWQLSLKADSFKDYTDLTVLSQRSSYGPSGVEAFFEALGDQGRSEYQKLNLLSMIVFPMSLAILFSVALGRISDAAGFGHAWNLAPFLVVAVATVENVGIAVLLHQYPETNNVLGMVCGLAAALKMRLVMYCSLSVVVGGGYVLFNRLVR